MAAYRPFRMVQAGSGSVWIAALLALSVAAPLAQAQVAAPIAFGNVSYQLVSDETGDVVKQRSNWSAANPAGVSFDKLGIRGNASLSADPQPTLTASVYAYGLGHDGTVGGDYTYFVRLNGDATTAAPVHMLGAVRLQRSTYGEYAAGLRVTRELTGQIVYEFNHASFQETTYQGQVNSFEAALPAALSMNTGELFRVWMFVNLNASQADNSSGPVDAWAEGYLDPAFMIDPGFAASNPGFSLAVSPAVGNPPFEISAVPEPGTVAMWALGLGAVMGAGRLRRRDPVAG